jgi:hypothetical protein
MIDAAAQIQPSGKQIADRRRPRRSKLFIFHVEACDLACAAATQKSIPVSTNARIRV